MIKKICFISGIVSHYKSPKICVKTVHNICNDKLKLFFNYQKSHGNTTLLKKYEHDEKNMFHFLNFGQSGKQEFLQNDAKSGILQLRV